MSIRLMNQCWLHSRSKGGSLLVLLAIADFSNDEGFAYPSIATLARKARLTPRNTQRTIRRLVACGELEVADGDGPHRTHLYRIVLREGADADGCHSVRATKCQDDIGHRKRMTNQPYKPSEETVIKKDSHGDGKKAPSEGDSSPPELISPQRDAERGIEETVGVPTVEQEFEEFWKAYPMRNGKRLDKPKALKNFRLIDPENRKLLLRAAVNYAASELVGKGIGIKDPHRWIRTGLCDEPWRDWIEPEQQTNRKEMNNGRHRLPLIGFGQRNYSEGIF